ncbi:MAG: M48 family metallopeptidase [Phycisphaerales bacterium]
MATDFFARQDAARKQTGRLVVLFILAVIAIMVMVYLVIAGVVVWGSTQSDLRPDEILLNPALLLGVGAGTIVIVGGASLFKIMELRGGGRVIAERLGGQLIHPDTTDLDERKILNVVEEMAIASGTPVPPVYIMNREEGVNAFAAGYSPNDAVIGITRGAVRSLSRDELQGVVAHEFSHILNGDMRLNIHLIGWLFGILVIGVIGYYLLRASFYAGGGGRRRSKEEGGGAAAILMIGLGLLVVGGVGTFFGNLIKAAVSRQREYLADASAVQFTRNPEGIAGALKKIGGSVHGAEIDHPNAPEASHMYFGAGVTSGLHGLFATHPPLQKRIRAIDPQWDGKFIKVEAKPEREPTSEGESASDRKRRRDLFGAVVAGGVITGGLEDAVTAARTRGATASSPSGSTAADRPAIELIGEPTPEHLEYARQLIESLPDDMVSAAHEPYDARALIFAMLLDSDETVRDRQYEAIAATGDTGVLDMTRKLAPIAEALERRQRLPLIEMATPALRDLSRAQYETFKRAVAALVAADEKITLFEWALQRLLMKSVAPQFEEVKPPRTHYYAIARLTKELEMLLSTLAWAGNREEADAARSFDAGKRQLQLTNLELCPPAQCRPQDLDRAIDELVKVSAPLKQRIIRAAAVCVAADRVVTPNEAEMLRAIAETLECPMPPLLPGQKLV